MEFSRVCVNRLLSQGYKTDIYNAFKLLISILIISINRSHTFLWIAGKNIIRGGLEGRNLMLSYGLFYLSWMLHITLNLPKKFKISSFCDRRHVVQSVKIQF